MPATHGGGSPNGTQGDGVSAGATAAAQAPATAPAINTARVLASLGGAEMRVGMHSAEFGSISIATTVTPGGLAAQISLDHGELGQALAAHLPGIEEKLGAALGVTATVEVRDTGAQSSGGGNAQNAQMDGRDTTSQSGSSQNDASRNGSYQGSAGYSGYGGVSRPQQASEMLLGGVPAELTRQAGARLSVRA